MTSTTPSLPLSAEYFTVDDLRDLETIALGAPKVWPGTFQIADGVTDEMAVALMEACSPDTVLALIAQARTAQQVTVDTQVDTTASRGEPSDDECDEAIAKALFQRALDLQLLVSEVSTNTTGHREWGRALIRSGFDLARASHGVHIGSAVAALPDAWEKLAEGFEVSATDICRAEAASMRNDAKELREAIAKDARASHGVQAGDDVSPLPEPDHALDGGSMPFFTAEQMRTYAIDYASALANRASSAAPQPVEEQALPPLPEYELITIKADMVGSQLASYRDIRVREYGEACARAAVSTRASSAPAEIVAWRFQRDSQAYPGVPNGEWQLMLHGRQALELQGKSGFTPNSSHHCWEPLYASSAATPASAQPVEAAPEGFEAALGRWMEARDYWQDDSHESVKQAWSALLKIAAPAAPVAQARNITEETAQEYMEESLWAFIDCAGNFPEITVDPRIWPHVLVYAKAAYRYLPTNVYRALNLAMTICDSVPTRLHMDEDPAIASIGKLVNAQDDGSHGYAVIRDALAELEKYGASPAPVAQAEANALTPLDYRAQGREEALAIILAQDPENPFADHTDSVFGGEDYSTEWNEGALRELLHIGDRKHDAYDRAEAAYWDSLGHEEEAKRELLFVQQAPFYKPLHDFLAKHEAWDLMGDLKCATTAPVAPQGAQPLAISASDTRAAFPDGFVLMPKRLTAENGAKGALSGEFKESIRVTCPECDGSGEIDDEIDCGQCNGEGTVEQFVTVGWDNIKDIYKRAVSLLAAPTAAGAHAARACCCPSAAAASTAVRSWLRRRARAA